MSSARGAEGSAREISTIKGTVPMGVGRGSIGSMESFTGVASSGSVRRGLTDEEGQRFVGNDKDSVAVANRNEHIERHHTWFKMGRRGRTDAARRLHRSPENAERDVEESYT